MNWPSFAFKNLKRHRLRTILTLLGITISTLMLFSIFAFNSGYDKALNEELESSGAHLYISMEGCPMQAASLILHGGEIPSYLQEDMLQRVEAQNGVRVAGGYLISTVITGGRADLFYGVTDGVKEIKPYWQLNGRWFDSPDEQAVILGYDLAKDNKKKPGDTIFIESLNQEFLVCGTLGKTGNEDDGFYFLPIDTQQNIFKKQYKLTAIGVQLTDITRLEEVKLGMERMGAYVVPQADISDLVGDLVGGTKSVMLSVMVIVLIVAGLGMFNTVMMATFERNEEFGYLRCVGARRRDVFRLILTETVLLSAAGLILGLALGFLSTFGIDKWIRGLLPYVPAGRLVRPTFTSVALTVVIIMLIGILAGLYPGYKASRVSPMEAVRNE